MSGIYILFQCQKYYFLVKLKIELVKINPSYFNVRPDQTSLSLTPTTC